MPYRDDLQHTRKRGTPILIRVICCVIVFVLLLVWGWLAEQHHRSLHHPSPLHNDPPSQPSRLSVYNLDHAHHFLPRQYVKILRYPSARDEEQAN